MRAGGASFKFSGSFWRYVDESIGSDHLNLNLNETQCRTKSIAARMDMMTTLLDAAIYVHAAYAAKLKVKLEDKYEPIHLISFQR